jgi:ABC-type Fe3+/spermidine/putrescine transport system ATPase subunit
MDAILELRQVSKHFAAHRAVREISLSVERGSFFSLLGPSGCGKTTTLRLIAGFEMLSGGEIRLNGARIDHLPPYRRNVNTVFQNYALFPHLTVQGNVGFGLREKGAARATDVAARIREVLEQVRLSGKEARKPSELSGGERQRVALARALVLAPDVLLLDEPLSALDPQLRKQVRAELKDLQRRSGVTFLLVTHDQEEALSLSDRMAIMNAGVIEQTGAPEALYRKPSTRFVASFLGAMNWSDGVGIRPEALRLTRAGTAGEGDGAGPGQRGIVRQATFLGGYTQVEIELGSGEKVTAHAPAGMGLRAGETVEVSWNPGDEMRFPA